MNRLEASEQLSSGTSLYSRRFKRYVEAIIALGGLILLSPLLLLCAILIKLDSRGPILFKQVRTGQYGRPFEILKLRTMAMGIGGPHVTVAGDPRITRVGRWLRRTKIDEVPQLINILRGDMSFVGPRPEVPKYTASYNARQRRILSVKPGITGPASLMFAREEELLKDNQDTERFYISELLPTKLEIDMPYCERNGFIVDLKLILRTLRELFRL